MCINFLQLAIEINDWPYTFPQSEDFPSSAQRGSVTGQLLVRDGYFSVFLCVLKFKTFLIKNAYAYGFHQVHQ